MPYCPETLAQLRERLPLALVKLYGARENSTVWKYRANVFDFESGLRLVISRKVIDINCDPVIHVAASLVPYTLTWNYDRSIRRCRIRDLDDWIKRLVIGQFTELHPTPLEFLGFADGGVPHFFACVHEMDRTEQRLLAV